MGNVNERAAQNELVRAVQPVESVGMIVIDSPPRNAFGRDVSSQFTRALDSFESDPGIRCVVITGSGTSFTAGADLKEQIGISGTGAEDYLTAPDQMSSVLHRLSQTSIPTIAAINGYALGGGLELALSCDIRICSTSARFVCSGVNVGLLLSWFRLPRIIGQGRAMEMLLSGRMYSPDTADAWGLVTAVVDDEELQPTAIALAATIASKAPLSVAATKRFTNMAFDIDLEESGRVQANEFVRLMSTHDHHEALAAFLEKRDPIYRAR